MLSDEDSEVFFQLKRSKKVRKEKSHKSLKLQKHYEILDQMQQFATLQESNIAKLIDTRLDFYHKNKTLQEWKYNISVSYFQQLKYESDTHEDSIKQSPEQQLGIEQFFLL